MEREGRKQITKEKKNELTGDFLKYILEFEFFRIGYKPIHEIIEEHKLTKRYPARFGGGLRIPRPPDPVPPPSIASEERRYIAQLLEAYGNHVCTEVTLANLPLLEEFRRHFERSR